MNKEEVGRYLSCILSIQMQMIEIFKDIDLDIYEAILDKSQNNLI